MDCIRAREALSARLDGEDAGVRAADLDAHVASCPGCAAWSAAAEQLHRTVRLGAAPVVPDQTHAILARAGDAEHDAALRPWQGALLAVGVLQLVVALPALVAGAASASSAHTVHELGSWDVALAVGFLFAAVRPARAWGLLPLVGALVGCMVATSVLDVAAGRAALATESTHMLEAMGLTFVWMLARLSRRPLGFAALRPA
jgi:predicted anti-sigma-YlaC factor YlaD